MPRRAAGRAADGPRGGIRGRPALAVFAPAVGAPRVRPGQRVAPAEISVGVDVPPDRLPNPRLVLGAAPPCPIGMRGRPPPGFLSPIPAADPAADSRCLRLTSEHPAREEPSA